MAMSFSPAHLKRYKDVAWLFLKYGRGDLVPSEHIAELNKQKSALPQEPTKAADLAADLEKMGPTFIKVGQLLSTRPDLLPVPYIEALTRLQDHVEPFPFADAEKILAQELGVRLSRAFQSIDPKPLAAASIGQVHRATLRGGREVAIKIQRPGIREKMIEDLDSLHEVAEFLDHHTDFGKRYELQRILDEFRKALLRELDYRQEAQNLITLGHNLKEYPHIVVPQPIDDYSTSTVLTMDYIAGYKLTDLSPVVRTEIDGATLSEEVFQAYLKQVLVDGFFHADPHPGNILLTKDAKIALLDLGMIARVTPHIQDSLLQVLLAVSEGRGEDAATIMISVSQRKDDFNESDLIRNVVDIVGRHKEASLKDIAVGKVMMELSKMAADNGLRTPSELTTLAKTLLNLDQLGTLLNPDFNPNESIRRNATAIMRRRLTSSLTAGNFFTSLLEAKDFAHRLPGRVNKILDAIANNDLSFAVDAIDEKKLMTGFQKVANRITIGLILASLIIGAALLARIDSPNTTRILGYPALATTFFLLAAAGGILLMVRILFYDDHA